MANFEIVTVTNNFKVNNKAKLYEFLGKLIGEDIYTDAYIDKDGNIYGWFGAYSDIMYDFRNNEDKEEDYDDLDYEKSFDEMVKVIQEILTEDSYCAIKSAGNEKLRFVSGDIVYITKKEVDIYSLQGIEKVLTEKYFPETKKKREK